MAGKFVTRSWRLNAFFCQRHCPCESDIYRIDELRVLLAVRIEVGRVARLVNESETSQTPRSSIEVTEPIVERLTVILWVCVCVYLC